ncbi:TRAP transporter small permease [Paracoccus aestuarii]|uniref:TRAP transporter small permease protein n=1 Tax=Paracoccus aestuarii TaxID=453842 RepID=A0A419A1B6_9RHOB|nr:TRAP transporter small permease [Paracoccus aestuarii]RJL06657.1 TRAP transporter small permease [Paracoccus aestuarii]WCR00915.1 TRAP transporter small permease [Paracoccus aestuarii]
MADRILGALRRANRAVALLLGIALILTVGFILTDVTLRGLGAGSLGGSDELSGYVMAAVASWGLAFALLERAHVRIDVVRLKLRDTGRAAMDVLAMIVTNGVVLLVAFQCWPVLQKTIERGSRANTPLETPLWIPQGIWFAGWLWFAFSATVVTLSFLLAGRRAALDDTIGIGSEVEP